MTMSISFAPALTERRISSHAGFERREAGREAGGDGGDGDAGAFERFDGGFDEGVVDADGADVEVQVFDLQSFDEVVFEWAAGFGAEAFDALGGVVAGERGEVHAGDGAEQPGGLPVLLDAAAGADGGGAALDGRGVDADLFDPADVERDAPVGDQFAAVQRYRNLWSLDLWDLMRDCKTLGIRVLCVLW